MSRGRRIVLVAAALLVPAQAAPAQTLSSSSSLVVFGAAGFSIRSIPVRISGQLTVDFHGDAATGCASSGLCGYSGTVSWRPPPSGALFVLSSRVHGRLIYQIGLQPQGNGFGASSRGVTTAMVESSGAPPLTPTSCLDATNAGSDLSFALRHGRVAFSLADATPALLETRCAGPLDGDVLPGLPAPELPLGAVLRGHTAMALTASQPFASHGFAGTVRSSVTMTLGHPGRVMRTRSPNLGQGFRQIQVLYRATVSGSVGERILGSADPATCAALGSCGVAGTEILTPHATHVRAAIGVIGSARTPYRDLLAAVGLGRGGAKRNVFTEGTVSWDGSVATANLQQGSATCSDSAPVGPERVFLTSAGGRLAARYTPGFGIPAARTRCPGPSYTSVPALASAHVPVGRLAHRTITLRLTTGARFADYGYEVATVPDLTVTLTRIGVRKISGAAVLGGSFSLP